MLKKYGILIVPGTLGLLLTVVVVNEPSVRYSVESYAPGYGKYSPSLVTCESKLVDIWLIRYTIEHADSIGSLYLRNNIICSMSFVLNCS